MCPGPVSVDPGNPQEAGRSFLTLSTSCRSTSMPQPGTGCDFQCHLGKGRRIAGTDLPSCCPEPGAGDSTTKWVSLGPKHLRGVSGHQRVCWNRRSYVFSVQRFRGCALAREDSTLNLEGCVFQPPFNGLWAPYCVQPTDPSEHLRGDFS